MANYATLKAAIADVIKTNGNNAITGAILQDTLKTMINSLGVGYQFVGIATPETNPGTPDQRVFYLASTPGTYVNFNGIELADNEVAILKYDSSWGKLSSGFAAAGNLNELWRKTGNEIERLEGDLYDISEDSSGTTVDLSGALVWSESRAVRWDSGSTYPSDGYNASGYVDIGAYPAIIYSRPKSTTASTPMGLAFYDANKNYISGQQAAILSPADGYIRTFIKVPFAAKYVRINENRDTSGWGNAYLIACETIIADSKIGELEEEDEAINSKIGEIEDQIYIRREESRTETNISSALSPFTSGRGINWQTGGTYSSSGYSASTYVDISGYDKIRYSRAKSTTASTSLGMAFYDEAQHFISGQQAAIMSPADGYVSTEIDIPQNAKYVRISQNNNTSEWGNAYLYGISIVYENVPRLDVMQEEIDNILVSTGDALICDQMDIVELNVISSTGAYVPNSNCGCTDFIPCYGAATLNYTRVRGLTGAGLAFYDSNKDYISGSYVDSVTGANGMVNHTVNVPEGAYYFRASGWNYANSLNNGAFYASLTGEGICVRGKRASNGESTFFSVIYNAAIDDLTRSDFSTPSQGETPVCTTGVVLLPPSYSNNGKPSRVIVNFHGWSHYVNYKQWGAPGSQYAGFMMQKERWANAGYVVVDVNHKSSSQKGNYSGLGSRQDNDCYRRAFEWVKERYNVEDSCFVVCGSAGGPNGINACYNWPDVKAAVWLDTWVDVAENAYPNGCGEYYYGYSGSYDASKVGTCNPALRIKSVGGVNILPMPQCPVKIYPLNRTSAGFLKPFLDVINAGYAIGDFYIRPCSGITHAVLVSGGDGTDPQAIVVDTEIIRWLNQH